jgi:hypothetical protein
MRGEKPLQRDILLPRGTTPRLRLATNRRRIDRVSLTAHYCVHRVTCRGGGLPNLPRARSRFFMLLSTLN